MSDTGRDVDGQDPVSDRDRETCRKTPHALRVVDDDRDVDRSAIHAAIAECVTRRARRRTTEEDV